MAGPDDKQPPGGPEGEPERPATGTPAPGEGAGAAGASPPSKPPAGAAPPAPPPKPAPKPDPLKDEVPSTPRDRLQEAFPDEIEEISYHAAEVSVRVRPGRLLEVLRFLRDDDASRMDFLADLCGADYPDRERRFEINYHLYSIPRGHSLRIKAAAGDGEEIPSVTGIWSTADWFEREIFDLFGVPFSGHPDLRRILMPEHWRGHPLRKDYPLAGFPDQHLKLR